MAPTRVDFNLHLWSNLRRFSRALPIGICVGTRMDVLMTDSPDKQLLFDKLKPFGQQHLLRYWDELFSAQRRELAAQIESIDLALIDSLYRGEVDQPNWHELSCRAEPPAAVRLADIVAGAPGSLGITPDAAHECGTKALAAGEVGVLLTAGGQGSRLGFELPKSLYPIGPLSGASLLQIHIEKVRALSDRYGVAIPLYLMTSPATHDDTIRFLAENNRFGLSESDLLVFCQGSMPAVDLQSGKLLLSARHQMFLSPDGHGGTVAALAASGALEAIKKRGIRQLFYLQVDNPLVPIGDPQFVGYHLLAESELTSLAVAKQLPQDKVGNFAQIDGNLNVIEYSDFPDEVAEQRDQHGQLKFWAGSIAVHVFDVGLFERAQAVKTTLPFHVARKKVVHLGQDGEPVSPDEPNALKFERFIFDLLPAARNPIVVEFAEVDCFAPLKNAPGAEKDTAQYVQQMMCAQYRRWLEAAGAKVAEGAQVEISPLFALDAAGVAERIDPGRLFETSQYITDS